MLEYFDNNRDTYFFEKNNRDTVDHDFIYLFVLLWDIVILKYHKR